MGTFGAKKRLRLQLFGIFYGTLEVKGNSFAEKEKKTNTGERKSSFN